MEETTNKEMSNSKLRTILAHNVRTKMLGLQWDVSALANRLELSRSGVLSILNGSVWVSSDTLSRMCNVFRCSPAELFVMPEPEESTNATETSAE